MLLKLSIDVVIKKLLTIIAFYTLIFVYLLVYHRCVVDMTNTPITKNNHVFKLFFANSS